MKYLPVGLNIQNKRCVVVGGGAIGTRKVENLLRAGASVHLVSPEASDRAVELARAGKITWTREPFRRDHLRGALLAVAATNDGGLNAQLVKTAGELGVLTCDASSAERSEVIFGALHEGGGLTVAVFTDGVDPSLARNTRDRIAAFLSEGKGPDPPAAG